MSLGSLCASWIPLCHVQRLGVRPKEEGRTFVRYCISRETFQALKTAAPGPDGDYSGPLVSADQADAGVAVSIEYNNVPVLFFFALKSPACRMQGKRTRACILLTLLLCSLV